MIELAAYVGLFVAAFGSATLLPMQSEAVLAGLLLAKMHPAWALLAVATLGNSLGSVVNWVLGRSIERFRDRPWFPVGEVALGRAEARYRRHGRWALLLAWVPIIGDPITVVAGVMREPFGRFVVLVTLAKCGRYLALYAMLPDVG